MNKAKNIVVLVSGGGTNLQVLIDAEKAGKNPNGKITAVISSKPDAYALKRAEAAGIKTIVHCRKDYTDTSLYSAEMLKLLETEQTDLIVYTGFMTILDDSVCKRYENRMLNVHPALIPSFCGKGFYGLHVHRAVLERGVKLTGATVHFVNEICDGGPIVLQKAVEVKTGDTPETLQQRVMTEAEQILLPQAVQLFCDEKIIVENGFVRISK